MIDEGWLHEQQIVDGLWEIGEWYLCPYVDHQLENQSTGALGPSRCATHSPLTRFSKFLSKSFHPKPSRVPKSESFRYTGVSFLISSLSHDLLMSQPRQKRLPQLHYVISRKWIPWHAVIEAYFSSFPFVLPVFSHAFHRKHCLPNNGEMLWSKIAQSTCFEKNKIHCFRCICVPDVVDTNQLIITCQLDYLSGGQTFADFPLNATKSLTLRCLSHQNESTFSDDMFEGFRSLKDLRIAVGFAWFMLV